MMKASTTPDDASTRTRTTRLAVAAGGGLIVLVFVVAFSIQGLRGWTDVVAATIVNLAPPLVLGYFAWRFAGREVDRKRTWPQIVAVHGSAATLFAALWTGSVSALVLLLQPAAAQNFLGAAHWHFTGGLMAYAVIAALGHATTTSRRLREREAAATRAELIALRAQLDPHFLFNTLHSIGALIRQDPTAAEQAVERFGELMRYVLESGRGGLVALEDELGFVRGYLALEALRLGARLHVCEAIDEECLECGVPPLLLQPLVENAIRHGIAPKLDGGTLRLSGAIEGDALTLAVADDGRGVEPSMLTEAKGLGLAITRRHLAAHFGTAAQMAIETANDRGFTVSLCLPIVAPRSGTMP